MGDLQVQAGLRAAIIVLVVAFALGAVVSWAIYTIVIRKRKVVEVRQPGADEAALYLVFSRCFRRGRRDAREFGS